MADFNIMNVLILSITFKGIINTRKEVIQAIITDGHEVTIAARYDDGAKELSELGAKCIFIDIDRRGTNPLKDTILVYKYMRLMRSISPDLVLSYTIKPNLFGGIACRILGIPQAANITGLGAAIENKGKLQKMVILLYRIGLKKVTKVFFQNTENRDFCLKNKMVSGNYEVIPGSGVNLDKYRCHPYPTSSLVKFLYVGRLMRDKGSIELFNAAQLISQEYPNVEFHIVGSCEAEFEPRFNQLKQLNIFVYHGIQKDVEPYLADCSCLIHPSYYEGMSNVCLEAAACGRPVITTNVAGCRETVESGRTGFLVQAHSAEDLTSKIKQFLSLSVEQRKEMGLQGRAKMETEFDRNFVVNAYMKVIRGIYNRERKG